MSTFLAGERSEIEKKLDVALSKDNFGAPSSLLREIAAATFDRCAPPLGAGLRA